MNNPTKALIFLLLFFGFIILFFQAVQYKLSPVLADIDFCEEMGYDTINPRGYYVPYKEEDYGRVTCLAFYAEGRETKNFDVVRDWRGKLHLVEK